MTEISAPDYLRSVLEDHGDKSNTTIVTNGRPEEDFTADCRRFQISDQKVTEFALKEPKLLDQHVDEDCLTMYGTRTDNNESRSFSYYDKQKVTSVSPDGMTAYVRLGPFPRGEKNAYELKLFNFHVRGGEKIEGADTDAGTNGSVSEARGSEVRTKVDSVTVTQARGSESVVKSSAD